MAIAYLQSANVYKSTANSTSPVTAAYDSGTTGTNRILMVAVGWESGPSNTKTVSGVTYNGVAMTLVQNTQSGVGSTRPQLEIWRLVNPATGSNTLSVSFNNPSDDGVVHISAAVFEGVDQTTPIGAVAETSNIHPASTAITACDLTFTSSTGVAFIALAMEAAGITPISSVSGWTKTVETEQGAADGGDALVIGYYATDAASAKNFDWTYGTAVTGNRVYAYGGVELLPASTSISVTIDNSVPEPGQEVVITKAGGTFVGTVVAELTDSAGTYVDVSSVLTGSGTTRTLTLPGLPTDGTVSLWDGSNATWKYIRWNTAITLKVTDDNGFDTVSLTITPPVDDHFDPVGASNDYLPAAGAENDEVYVHVASGDGEGLPLIGGFQGNTVPSTVHFMTFDLSASPKVWLSLTSGDGIEIFDVSAGTYNGDFADRFDGTVGTNIGAHTPDADVVGTGWTGERDRSSSPAYSGDPVNLNGSGKLILTSTGQGATADVGTVNPDMTVYWACTAESHRWTMHGRRVDENEFVGLNIRSTGLMTLEQYLGNVSQPLIGQSQYTATFVAGQTYAIRLELVGTSSVVYLDDLAVISAELPLAPNAEGTKIGIYAGGASYVGTGILFEGVNVVSDYDPAVRTLTFSDETVTPGQTITCTVVGSDFAGTIDVGSIDGVAVTPASADLNSCDITIPAITEFDDAGTHATTQWYQEIVVTLSDGSGTSASGTIQVVAPVSGSFGIAGADTYIYPPTGAAPGNEAYVHTVSGTGVSVPTNFSYTAGSSSVVYFLAFDKISRRWLARREENIEPETFAGGGSTRYGTRAIQRTISRIINRAFSS